MVHLGALPGSPLHDAEAGLAGLVDGARQDLKALQAAGFDAVMFGNENDRPYEFKVDTASTATMAYVIGALRSEITRAVRRQRAVGPDEHDGARRRDRRGLRPRDLHRHLCLRHGAVDPGRRRGAALPRPAGPERPRASSTTSRPNSPGRSTGGASPTARGARCSPRIPDAILVSGRDHRRGGGDVRPRGGEGGAARHAGARQYRRQARDRRRRAQDRRRLHRRLVAEGRRQHLERRSIRNARPSSCGSSARRGAADHGARHRRRATRSRTGSGR